MRALTCLLLLCLSNTGSAMCNCIWKGSFTQVQTDADLVISGTVLSSKGNSVDIKIEQILRGKEFQEEIRVWMNPGELCRPEVDEFSDSSQWVMALHQINEHNSGDFNPNTPNISTGRIGDYSLSICGGYWLSRKDNLVTGNLAAGTRWDRDPKMSPVILGLVAAFVRGDIDEKNLREAAIADPALQELQLETRLFLRRENRKSGFE